ncbi:family 1 encapsulin nanocompartment shell protein [Candidatus Nanopelagicales bacterium]|nr:family 1 encapsulin nanocompartment shell protein [Candidatus Nanopelagicales bacterium]
MDHLLRALAPLSEAGWAETEAEATRSLRNYLAGRKLLDYSASGGWQRSSRGLGRIEQVSQAGAAVQMANRVSAPMTELRADFSLRRDALADLDRGATDFDTQPVIDAARAAAEAEDDAIFAGNTAAGISGLIAKTPNAAIPIDQSLSRFAHDVARAIDQLQELGIEGPYAIAMGPRCWTAVMESAESGGYPLLKHLRLLLSGPVVWAPTLAGALVVSQRGGDYEIVGGQDWVIGYDSCDADQVNLYLQSSFTFVINTPEAAVPLAFA